MMIDGPLNYFLSTTRDQVMMILILTGNWQEELRQRQKCSGKRGKTFVQKQQCEMGGFLSLLLGFSSECSARKDRVL